MDLAAYAILSLYISGNILRLIAKAETIDDQDKSWLELLWPIASNLIFAVLFYFVFQMELVMIKVRSETHSSYRRAKKYQELQMRLTISLFIVLYMIPNSIIVYLL